MRTCSIGLAAALVMVTAGPAAALIFGKSGRESIIIMICIGQTPNLKFYLSIKIR